MTNDNRTWRWVLCFTKKNRWCFICQSCHSTDEIHENIVQFIMIVLPPVCRYTLLCYGSNFEENEHKQVTGYCEASTFFQSPYLFSFHCFVRLHIHDNASHGHSIPFYQSCFQSVHSVIHFYNYSRSHTQRTSEINRSIAGPMKLCVTPWDRHKVAKPSVTWHAAKRTYPIWQEMQIKKTNVQARAKPWVWAF